VQEEVPLWSCNVADHEEGDEANEHDDEESLADNGGGVRCSFPLLRAQIRPTRLTHTPADIATAIFKSYSRAPPRRTNDKVKHRSPHTKAQQSSSQATKDPTTRRVC
jgi:hypothetical protein